MASKANISDRVKEFARETAQQAEPNQVGETVLAGSPLLLYAALATKYSTVAAFSGGAGVLVVGAAVLSAHTDIRPAEIAERAVTGAGKGVNPQTSLGLAALHALDELHIQGQLPEESDEWLNKLDLEDIEQGIEKAPEAAPREIDLTEGQISEIGGIVASMYSISDIEDEDELFQAFQQVDEDEFSDALPAA